MPRRKRLSTPDLVRELVTAHGLDRATEIAEALHGRGARLALRLPAAKDRAYRVAAKAAGLSISRWIERACDAAVKG